ncbi:MAG: hypothetical protein Kow00109_05940 [Acidobacteriota bacterium]
MRLRKGQATQSPKPQTRALLQVSLRLGNRFTPGKAQTETSYRSLLGKPACGPAHAFMKVPGNPKEVESPRGQRDVP